MSTQPINIITQVFKINIVVIRMNITTVNLNILNQCGRRIYHTVSAATTPMDITVNDIDRSSHCSNDHK